MCIIIIKIQYKMWYIQNRLFFFLKEFIKIDNMCFWYKWRVLKVQNLFYITGKDSKGRALYIRLYYNRVAININIFVLH